MVTVDVDHHQGFIAPGIAGKVEGVLVGEMPGEFLIRQVADLGLIPQVVEHLVVSVAMDDTFGPLEAVIEMADPFAKPRCNCCFFLFHVIVLPIKNPLDGLASAEWATITGACPPFLCYPL